MAQQGQIQQHEWETIDKSQFRCIHCPCMKTKHRPRMKYDISWFIKGIGFMFTEPKCITRTINAPQRQADK